MNHNIWVLFNLSLVKRERKKIQMSSIHFLVTAHTSSSQGTEVLILKNQ